jgi:hypothetical protein
MGTRFYPRTAVPQEVAISVLCVTGANVLKISRDETLSRIVFVSAVY